MAGEQQEKVKGVVDIIFLIDATGSMQPFINALKENVSLFIDTLTTANPQITPVKDWRGKVVGYRDVEVDGNDWLVDRPFVRNADEVKGQLAALNAEGGGDIPESLLDALYVIATMGQSDRDGEEDPNKWRYRSDAVRVVIVFTDAPFKPTMVIPEARGGTVDDVINACMASKIILSIFAPDHPGYHSLAEMNKSEYEPLVDEMGNAVDLDKFTGDQEKFQDTLAQLAKSVTKSVEAEAVGL